MSPTSASRWTGRVLPFLVLASSIGFTIFAWYTLDQFATDREIARFEQSINADVSEIEKQLELYTSAVNGISGLFAASNEVERHEWKAYLDGTQREKYYPGLKRIIYIQSVNRSDLEAHERIQRASGAKNYRVQTTSMDSYLHPAIFIEPDSELELRDLGMDHGADLFLSRAFEKTETGTLFSGFSSSGPYNGRFIICKAASNAGIPGWIIAVVKRASIFDTSTGVGFSAAIRVTAFVDSSRTSACVFESEKAAPRRAGISSQFIRERIVNSASVPFLIRFEATPAFHAATDRTIPRLVFFAGLLISMLLFWIALVLASGRRAALILAERITHDLARSEEKYRTLVRNVPGVIFRSRHDRKGIMEFISDGIEEISGYPASEFFGDSARTYGSIIHREDIPIVDRVVSEGLGRHEPYIIEYRIVHRTGAVRWVYEKGRGVHDSADNPLFLDGAIFDITSRKTLEEQLYQAQKMESVGQLAGGIAHDFNNILMVMQFHAQRVGDLIAENHDARHSTEVIQKSAKRATDLTQQLLAFSRRQVLRLVAVDMNAVIASTMRMLDPIISSNIEMVTRFAHDTEPVRADQGLLGQVIVNLAVNARDSMPDGGTLTIETGRVTFESPASHHFGMFSPGDYGFLVMTDTGAGISKADMTHIFEPFFTTKPLGKGTGLGLSVVYGIIQQHEGGIRCDSESGKGARFEIYIPLAKAGDMPPEISGEAGLDTALTDPATVLIVEDNDEVRMIAREILVRLGCSVLLARDGEDALRISQQHPGPIHLLFTDVVMPKMGGAELADRFQRQRAETKVLFTSGYADELIVRHGITRQSVNFIPKPYSEGDLLWKARSILSARV